MGSRDNSVGPRTFEAEFSIAQRFEINGQRGRRIAAADAAVQQRTAAVESLVLEAQRVALAALYRAAHAEQLRQLGDAAVALAEEATQAAQARYEAGETAILDVNVAKVEVARARREQLAASALVEGALGDLRELLALPAEAPLRVETPLATQSDLPAMDALMLGLLARPDLRALQAAAEEAEAELELARARRVPDLFGGFGMRREETEPTIGGIVGMSIPLFQKQTGAIAAATARLSETRSALDTRRVVLAARLRTAHTRYTLAARAADTIASEALPLLNENQQLTRESYQAGKIGQLDVLVIQRAGFTARREALDAQLEAMLAALDVRGIAGLLR
jgi:cobalt-zinc-cadmium efflux system outer membrane protein